MHRTPFHPNCFEREGLQIASSEGKGQWEGDPWMQRSLAHYQC